MELIYNLYMNFFYGLYTIIGTLYRTYKKYDEALYFLNRSKNYFKKNIYNDTLNTLEPFNVISFEVAKCYAQIEEFIKSIHNLNYYINYRINDKYIFHLYMVKANLQRKAKMYTKSEQTYNVALNKCNKLRKEALVKNDLAEIFCRKAELYLDMDEYDNALEQINKSIQINNKFGFAYKVKAVILYKKGEPENGYNNLKKAKKLKSSWYIIGKDFDSDEEKNYKKGI